MWKQCNGYSADDSRGVSRDEIKAGSEGGPDKTEEPGLWTRRHQDPLRLQHDHSVENQEQRMDPPGNQPGRPQDRSRCGPRIGTCEREHSACNLQEVRLWHRRTRKGCAILEVLQEIAASASVQRGDEKQNP